MRPTTIIGFGLLLASTLVFAPASAQAFPSWQFLSSANGDLDPPTTDGNEQTASLVLDVDLDGDMDFVIGDRTSTTEPIVWYRRDAAGWTRFILESGARRRMEAGGAVHDIDGDGDDDIVFGADGSSNEIWWWENPNPNFGANWTRRTIKQFGGDKHHDMIFGDFDGDGAVEFAYWNQQPVARLYVAEIPADPKAPGDWPATEIFTAPDAFYEGIAAGDIDLDGVLDLSGAGYWFRHEGGGTYSANLISVNREFTRASIGQLIPGGRPEIVISGGDANGPLEWYQWDGAQWVRNTLFADTFRTHSLRIADVDQDGHLDIFAAEMRLGSTNPDAKTWVLYGDSLGGFVVTEVDTGVDNHESRLRDLDGDGDLDILGKPFDHATPGVNIWLQVDGGGGPGPQPPTAPGDLVATAHSPTQVVLAWTASTDNGSVVEYRILRDGFLVGVTDATFFSDGNLTPDIDLTYAVVAVDNEGNESDPSALFVVRPSEPRVLDGGGLVVPFGLIDRGSGAYQALGSSTHDIVALAFDDASQTVYAVVTDPVGGAPHELATIDPATGFVSVIATISDGADVLVQGLAYDASSSTLYGVSCAAGGACDLHSIDTATAVASLVGSDATTVASAAFGLAVNPITGTLFGVRDHASNGPELVTVDKLDGAQTGIGPLGAGLTDVSGLGFCEDTGLYSHDDTGGVLLRVDAATGAATPVGASGQSPVLGLACALEDTTPDPTLLAAYGFEEATGATVFDLSGNGNNGVIEDAMTRTGNLAFGAAVEGAGSSGRVNLGGLDIPGSALTIALWFRANAFGIADARLISKTSGTGASDHYWMISTVSGPNLRARLKTADGGTTTLIASGTTIGPNQWTHVALTYDGAAMRIYINGVEAASTAKTGALSTNPAVIAAIGDNAGGDVGFDGVIDQVTIHTRALSPEEIRRAMLDPIGEEPLDTQPPSTPDGLADAGATENSIALSWNPASDDFLVSGYRVYRDGLLVGAVLGESFSDLSLPADTTFSYTIEAFDADWNFSSMSAPFVVQTLPAGGGDPPAVPTMSGLALLLLVGLVCAVAFRTRKPSVQSRG